MDELAAFRGGARREVILFNKSSSESSGCGVQGHPNSRDSTTDDQNIELFALQAIDVCSAVEIHAMSLNACLAETAILLNIETTTEGKIMAGLAGTSTHENLKEAFARESQANLRYLWFAQKADVEGYPDIAGLFRNVAAGETGRAYGHLEYLAEVGDPETGDPIGDTEQNLKSSIASETYESTEKYPDFAKTARDEGFTEIADWFEILARAEKGHAARFAEGLKSIS
ncbi:MAG: hypothetical protein RL073_1137 [Actinomycetota bacterium]